MNTFHLSFSRREQHWFTCTHTVCIDSHGDAYMYTVVSQYIIMPAKQVRRENGDIKWREKGSHRRGRRSTSWEWLWMGGTYHITCLISVTAFTCEEDYLRNSRESVCTQLRAWGEARWGRKAVWRYVLSSTIPTGVLHPSCCNILSFNVVLLHIHLE